jgi:flagellar hook assembly protein FlgD
MRMTIHDVAGRQVRELQTGEFPAGSHEAKWDGRDDRGVRVASGIYFCRIQAGELVGQRTMVLLK